MVAQQRRIGWKKWTYGDAMKSSILIASVHFSGLFSFQQSPSKFGSYTKGKGFESRNLQWCFFRVLLSMEIVSVPHSFSWTHDASCNVYHFNISYMYKTWKLNSIKNLFPVETNSPLNFQPSSEASLGFHLQTSIFRFQLYPVSGSAGIAPSVRALWSLITETVQLKR